MPEELIALDASQRALTLFALGGTGIRAVEPLLHLCAFGLGPRQLNIVMIDPDQSNAAIDGAKSLLALYQRVRGELLKEGAPADGYFRTEVKDVLGAKALWSPISDEENNKSAAFASRVDEALMTGAARPLSELFDLLYAERVRQMDLTLGFRGVPSIGTVFMNRLREQSFFEQLLVEAKTDTNAVFFAVGSIFGGTGAAALPVVGRALVDGLQEPGKNGINGVAQRKVGAALIMPYFTLPAPPSSTAEDGGIRPEAAIFAQNAAAALPTYTSGQARFGSYYVLGDDEPREQEKNAVGGAAQKNKSHYIEFYAALAALDFTARGGEDPTARLPKFRVTGVERGNVQWSDLPIAKGSLRRLMGGFIAAHSYLTVVRPDGKPERGVAKTLAQTTWAQELGLNSDAFEGAAPLLDALGEFFFRAWVWAGHVGGATPAMELVRAADRSPSDVPLDGLLVRSSASRALPVSTSTGLEAFRPWNLYAARQSERGMRGMLEVMRNGSEAVI